MPQRAISILTGLMGLIALALLVLIGADLLRAAQTGPRWKRNLLTAGLLLLAALGPVSCAKPNPVAFGPVSNAKPNPPADEWVKISRVLGEAEEVASGKRGSYPFDRAGQSRLIKSLEESLTDVAKLYDHNRLNAEEAQLLVQDLLRLTRDVQRYRPTEDRYATCYEPSLLPPSKARAGIDRLADRLPLLEKLARNRQLHPEVLLKLLAKVTADTEEIRKALTGAQVPRDLSREKAEKVSMQVAKALQEIDVAEAWPSLGGLAQNGTCTMAYRETADELLEKAKASVAKLNATGFMTAAELQLVLSDLTWLREDLHRDPPVSSISFVQRPQNATMTLKRLNENLELLDEIAGQDKVSPTLYTLVIPNMQMHLWALMNADRNKMLTDAQLAELQKIQAHFQDVLVKLRPYDLLVAD